MKNGSTLDNLFVPLFTISSGTIATLLALYKLFEKTEHCAFIIFILSLIILFLSTVAYIVYSLIPRTHKISGETELINEYHNRQKTAKNAIMIWLICWSIGAALGIISLLILISS